MKYQQLALFPDSDVTQPTTWATSSLTAIDQLAMRHVAEQFPDGPVAQTVAILDSRERKSS